MSLKYEDFINDEQIEKLSNIKSDKNEILEILKKAEEKKGLSPEEAAKLCNIQDNELLEKLFETAKKIKYEIYGKRIVFFAPLYVSSYCQNNCSYCAFRSSNKNIQRHTLTDTELEREVKLILSQGHKRSILVFGETQKTGAEFIADTVKKVYGIKTYNSKNVQTGSIRRVNINAAPLDVEGYKIVKAAGIGTYQVFQETYHKATYARVHPKNTIKGDYYWRLFSMHRAFEGGIDDLGLGALFGLYNWKFELLSLLYHAESLEKYFNVGPHTISFPRIEPAYETPYVDKLDYGVNNQDFKKIIAILRLSVPYTGLILTCRENPSVRDEVIELGCSQIDAGSQIGIGGYFEASKKQDSRSKEQFELSDNRSLDEVIEQLLKKDYIPSFCTACYRLGRTGEHFMEMAKPGYIKNFCQPNAMLTFYEYLCDYGSSKNKEDGKNLILKSLESFEIKNKRKT
jgi:2-iminoacetate synthase